MFTDWFRSGPAPSLAATPAPLTPETAFSEAGWRTLGRRLLREPLTHFLILGVLIFIAAHIVEERTTRFRIAIGPAQVSRIVASYTQQYGAEPTPTQLRTMINNYVREEIYLREGLALGLDRNDEIVRRRVAQKYDFLQQDNAVAREPDETQLRQWFRAHPDNFHKPTRRSFEQLYFASDQQGDAAAQQRAKAALATVNSGGPLPVADDFPGPKVISELSAEDTNRLFGGDDFAKAVFAARPGQWAGPFRSGFGWHIVRVTNERPASQPSFAEAREDVRVAWREADRQARNADGYHQLRARYAVTIDGVTQ